MDYIHLYTSYHVTIKGLDPGNNDGDENDDDDDDDQVDDDDSVKRHVRKGD